MRVVFMGTPAIAVPTLRALADAGHEIACVVTQPDRPRGRGMAVTPSPVKQLAMERDFTVFQPQKVKEHAAIQKIREFAPHVIVVVAFGQILPTELLYRNMAHFGAINLHASLLPAYRGPAPINWAIVNGDRVTGVTTMYITEKVDSGDILLKREVEITPDDTAASLGKRMSEVGADLVVETLAKAAEGTLSPKAQDPALVTCAPMLKKEDGLIDWGTAAVRIWNQVRGLYPWPGTHTYHGGGALKVIETAVLDEGTVDVAPGTVLRVGAEGMTVATGRGRLLVKQVQPAGRGPMTAREYAAGHRLREGMVLGKEVGGV